MPSRACGLAVFAFGHVHRNHRGSQSPQVRSSNLSRLRLCIARAADEIMHLLVRFDGSHGAFTFGSTRARLGFEHLHGSYKLDLCSCAHLRQFSRRGRGGLGPLPGDTLAMVYIDGCGGPVWHRNNGRDLYVGSVIGFASSVTAAEAALDRSYGISCGGLMRRLQLAPCLSPRVWPAIRFEATSTARRDRLDNAACHTGCVQRVGARTTRRRQWPRPGDGRLG